jgi:hypothetical protein
MSRNGLPIIMPKCSVSDIVEPEAIDFELPPHSPRCLLALPSGRNSVAILPKILHLHHRKLLP